MTFAAQDSGERIALVVFLVGSAFLVHYLYHATRDIGRKMTRRDDDDEKR